MPGHSRSCFLCDADSWNRVAVFDEPQPGENTFGVEDYHRELWQCANCGLFLNEHQHDLSGIYAGAYRKAAYEPEKVSRFQKIMNLPFEESDNKQRIRRVMEYIERRSPDSARRVCDVGSGMGVFPAGILNEGWQVTAIDPDEGNLRQLQEMGGGINCVPGYFPHVEMGGGFDLITFNKVLEHIEPIVETLAGASTFLAPEGFVYIELPDGETALQVSPKRAEFCLEHYYAFSIDSIALLARRAGMRVELAERIRDPSGKFTLYAFLSTMSR